MMKMYNTEFSQKIPISKVEQGIDGSCFLPEGSNSKLKSCEAVMYLSKVIQLLKPQIKNY